MGNIFGTIRIEFLSEVVTLALPRLLNVLISQDVLENIGHQAVFFIQKRTLAGKDLQGQLFKPYSDSYKLFRKQAGRPVNKVDLFFSGELFSAFTHKVERDGTVKVFVSDAASSEGRPPAPEIAADHHFGKGVPKREFFALNADEIQKIIQEIKDHTQEVLKQFPQSVGFAHG